MGLAAVPFGTAQADDYEIKVTQEYTCDPNDPKSEKDGAMHFKISVGKAGEEPHVAEIVWPNDKEYPNPIFEPNGFFRSYGNELRAEMMMPDGQWSVGYDVGENCLEWANFYKDAFEKSSITRERIFSAFGVSPDESMYVCGKQTTVRELIAQNKRGLELVKERAQ